MPDKSVKPLAASNNSIAAALNCTNTKSQVKFDASHFKQGKVHLLEKKMVNIDVVYKKNLWSFNVGIT